jgi:WD40 repeat protein
VNAPAAAVPTAPDNPFIGVQPYPEGRTLYGREQESAELADLLISRRIVLLYSPSGAGKTSLINTALRKDLALRGKGRFRASSALRVGYLPEALAGNRYVVSTLHHLERSLPEGERIANGALAGYTLARYLAERWDPYMQQAHPKSRRDLLVFDQFEELFTLDPTDVDAKHEFLAQVAEALGDRDEGDEARAAGATPLRWALFAMREDFIAELDPYKAILPTALATRLRMNLLSREAAQRVILCTAADAGADFGEDTVARIVADLARVRSPRGAPGEWVEGPHVEPVQLQVVCRRLWAHHIREGKRHLRPEDLAATADSGDDARALGAVDDALASFYADCVQEAAGGSTTRERAIRDWIESALVSRAKLRSQVMLDPATPLPVPAEALRALGGTLLRKDVRGGREWLELTHDRLIEPLLWDNNRWRARHLSLLQMQAHLWDAAGRAEGFLLTGDALANAAAWASTHDHELSDVDRRFLAAALKARDEAKGRRRNRALLAFGAIAGVITLLVIGHSLRLREVNTALADQTAKAIAGKALADRQSEMSGIRFNLSEADVLRQRDPLGSILRALTSEELLGRLVALKAEPAEVAAERITVEATLANSLREAPPVVLRYAGHGNAVRRALFLPDGRIVSAGYDGTLQLWRAADGHPLDLVPTRGAVLFSAAVEAARGLIADGDGLERIRLWRVDGEALQPLAEIAPEPGRAPARVTALAFTAGGDVLVAATWDRRLLFFDVTRPEAPRRIAALDTRAHAAVVYSLAASPDGLALATGSWDGTVGIWRNLPTPQRPDARPSVTRLEPDPGAERAAINSVAFSPRGRWLAAGGHEGSVFVWDVSRPDPARSLRRLKGEGGHKGTVFGVAFDGAETTLATAAIDRRVVLWRMRDVAAWKPGDPLPLADVVPALPERLYGVAFDPTRAETLALAGGPSVFLVDVDRPPSPLAAKLDGAETSSGNWADHWQAIAIADDGGTVLASRGDTVWRWSARPDRGYALRSTEAIRHAGLARVAMDSSGSIVLTGARDGSVRAWRLGEGDATDLLGASSQPVMALALTRDGGHAAASVGSEIVVWRLGPDRSATEIAREPLSARRVRALAFDSRGQRLAAGASDGAVLLWSVAPDGVRALAASQAVQPSEINVIAFAPGDARLATGAEDSTLQFWNVADLTPKETYTEHRSGIVSLGFCAVDGQPRLFSADRDGEVVARLSLSDQRHTRALMESFRKQRYLAVTPDCRRLATSGAMPLAWDLDASFIRRQACRLVDVGPAPVPACAAFRQAARP